MNVTAKQAAKVISHGTVAGKITAPDNGIPFDQSIQQIPPDIARQNQEDDKESAVQVGPDQSEGNQPGEQFRTALRRRDR